MIIFVSVVIQKLSQHVCLLCSLMCKSGLNTPQFFAVPTRM